MVMLPVPVRTMLGADTETSGAVAPKKLLANAGALNVVWPLMTTSCWPAASVARPIGLALFTSAPATKR